jgi:hypothetical protein
VGKASESFQSIFRFFALSTFTAMERIHSSGNLYIEKNKLLNPGEELLPARAHSMPAQCYKSVMRWSREEKEIPGKYFTAVEVEDPMLCENSLSIIAASSSEQSKDSRCSHSFSDFESRYFINKSSQYI